MKQASPFKTVHSGCIAVTPVKDYEGCKPVGGSNPGWEDPVAEFPGSSCLTCQHHLKHSSITESLSLVSPLPLST